MSDYFYSFQMVLVLMVLAEDRPTPVRMLDTLTALRNEENQ